MWTVELSCAFKVNTRSSQWDKCSFLNSLGEIKGVGLQVIDSAIGMVYVSGRVDPATILERLNKHDKSVELLFVEPHKASTDPITYYEKALQMMQMHQYPMGGGYPMDPYGNVTPISVDRNPILHPPMAPRVPNYGYLHQYPNVYYDPCAYPNVYMQQYPMGGGYPMDPYRNIHRPLIPPTSVSRYPIPPPPTYPNV
ncbi:hypothetical protein ACFE04_002950 [Oxalis oulophora]